MSLLSLLVGVALAAAEPPVALAGEPLMAYPGDSISLDGSASYDPGGGTLRYQWVQVGGPEVKLEGAASGAPSFSPDDAGTHAFQLVVAVDGVSSEPDVVDVIVVDPEAGSRLDAASGCQAAPAMGGLLLAMLAPLVRRRR